MTATPSVESARRPTHTMAREARIIASPPSNALTLPEVIVGSVVLVVAVFAWMSLLLLDNHVGTRAAVAVASVGALSVIGAVVFFLAPRPVIQTDVGSLVLVPVLAVIAAVMFFPGFSYGVTDKDPGVYMAAGAAFAQHHSYSFADVLGQHVSGLADQSPGSRFPGVWLLPHSTTVVVQFYHLWPGLLAMAHDLGGLGLESQVAPFIGVLAICVFALLLRRAVPGSASLPAAAIGSLLLTTNMMEVWQAKYPSTEIFAQLIFVTILLGVCIALSTGWRPAAGAAGLLLGIGWLERPDFVLMVGIAVATGAVLIALRRFDAGAGWFAAGFAVVLPHALWQAYAGARQYTLANNVPKLTTLVAGFLVVTILAFGIRALRPVSDGIPRLLSQRNWQIGLGLGLCAIVAGLMAFGFLRPRLLGADTMLSGGHVMRTFNEQNMRRLSWFLTLAAFPIAGLGLAVISLRRWRAGSWAAVLPPLIVMPIYVATSRVASRLMWWVRRYVPEVLPGIILLMAFALSAALVWRYRRRRVMAIPALAVAGTLLGVYLSQSLPLRHHNEFGGSFQVTAEMASVAGSSTGVYLFGQKACCTSPEYLFGGALWLERGQLDALMPNGPQGVGYVKEIVAAMPGHPVFIVWAGTTPPPLGSIRVVAARHITASLPMWEESDTYRPTKERPPIPVDFTVWRVAP